jgi:hypothetical protein
MDIDNYESRRDRIVECADHSAEVQFRESPPSVGTAIRVGHDDEALCGRLAEHLGNRRAEIVFSGTPDDVQPGDAVKDTGRPAAFRPPDETGHLRLTVDSLTPESEDSIPFEWTRPDFADLAASRPAVAVGDELLDIFSPIAAGGLNLIVDGRPSESTFSELTARVEESLGADVTISVVGPEATPPDWANVIIDAPADAWGAAMALRAGVCLAADARGRGRSVFFAGRLPAPREASPTERRPSESQRATGASMQSLVNRIGDGLLSVDGESVTSLLQLPVTAELEGLESIIETLGIGESDAQIVIGNDGCYRPERSTSDADRDASARQHETEKRRTLRRAAELQQKRAIWGDDELDPKELDIIHRAESWRRPLFCDTVPQQS